MFWKLGERGTLVLSGFSKVQRGSSTSFSIFASWKKIPRSSSMKNRSPSSDPDCLPLIQIIYVFENQVDKCITRCVTAYKLLGWHMNHDPIAFSFTDTGSCSVLSSQHAWCMSPNFPGYSYLNTRMGMLAAILAPQSVNMLGIDSLTICSKGHLSALISSKHESQERVKGLGLRTSKKDSEALAYVDETESKQRVSSSAQDIEEELGIRARRLNMTLLVTLIYSSLEVGYSSTVVKPWPN
ncbi:hypothetical protein VNO77_08657 [Canavalia gladiata]|uniref:Uncharacterized protein n=1 Tax=Canavalia gladiata TaxID=3824 RepID=A0AAN9R141_CANGL